MGKIVQEVLSNICNRLDESYYKIAKTCGIERTTFTKIKNGDRNLTEANLKQILSTLPLLDCEITQLWEAYYRERMGQKEYDSLMQIEEVILELSKQKMKKNNIAGMIEENDATAQVKKVLEDMREEKNIFLYAFLPYTSNIYEVIKEYLARNREKEISYVHLFHISPDTTIEDIDGNMRGLVEIIDLLRHFPHVNFKPYGYTNKEEFGESYGVLYPYYIITPKKCLLISQDGTNVLEAKDDRLKADFEKRFRVVLKKDKVRTCVKMSNNFQSVLEKYMWRESYYYLYYQPCFELYVNESNLRKYLMIENETYLCMFIQYFKEFQKVRKRKKNQYNIFSKKGIMDFAGNGVIHEFSSRFVKPIEPEDRIYFLQKIKEDPTQVVLRDEKLGIESIAVTVNVDKNVIIAPSNRIPELDMRYIVIEEPSVVSVFTRYVKFIATSEYYVSEELKKKWIDEAIEVVKEQI